MKRLLFIVFFLQIYVESARSQNINYISSVLNYYLQMGDMIYDDGGLMMTGDIVDSTLLWGYFIGRLDSNGEMSCFQHYIDTGRVKQLVFAPIVKVKDDFFIAMGFAWRKSRVMLVAFNSNCDTLFTREYKVEPDDSLHYQVMLDMIHIPGKGYVATGSVEAYKTMDSLKSQAFILYLDEDFNLVWQSQYGDRFNNMAIKVDYLGNDTLLIFGINLISKYPTHNSPWQRSFLFSKISLSNGELFWEKRNENEIRSAIFNFVKTPDKQYILNSSELIERYFSGMRPGNLFARNSVFKLDHDFDYQWEVHYGEKTITPYNYSWDIVSSIENDGVISVGSVIDTSNRDGFIRSITKISWAGDSIWTRYYQPFHVNPEIYKFDTAGNDKIVATEDGYIIGVNMSLDTLTTEFPYVQQLWFFEIDQFGCHIPGCQLPVSVSNPDNDSKTDRVVMVYPNPSSSMVNILLKGSIPDDAYLRLYNNLGIEVFHIKDVDAEIEYILDVSGLPSGIYNAIVDHHGNILTQSRVVINQ